MPTHADRPTIDVYPVGVLSSVRRLWRVYTHPSLPPVARRHAWRHLRADVRRTLTLARNGEWRNLKNHFNGYLAEPTPLPGGLRRCGSGWTRRRALRSLERHARRPGVDWGPLQPVLDEALGRR